MNNTEQLGNFIDRITSDANLTTSHIGLCTALISIWIKSDLSNPFNVSRKRLMTAAKIKSITTYHKVISELATLNYVKYEPSYHPGKGSLIRII